MVIVEGLPAGLNVTAEQIQNELGRRRLGYGRGPRQRFEVDEIELLGGIRHGRTLGSPVAIEIKNTEWFRSDVWHEEMSPAPGKTKNLLLSHAPVMPIYQVCRNTGSLTLAMCWSVPAPERLQPA